MDQSGTKEVRAVQQLATSHREEGHQTEKNLKDRGNEFGLEELDTVQRVRTKYFIFGIFGDFLYGEKNAIKT